MTLWMDEPDDKPVVLTQRTVEGDAWQVILLSYVSKLQISTQVVELNTLTACSLDPFSHFSNKLVSLKAFVEPIYI